MKTIHYLLVSILLLLSGAMTASAQYSSSYPYNYYDNSYYQNTAHYSSPSNNYLYSTNGCYVYRYDTRTQITTLLSTSCDTYNNYHTHHQQYLYQNQISPNYTYYPTPQYQGCSSSYIYMYDPITGLWYPSNQNNSNCNNRYYYQNYTPTPYYTPTASCYYQNGYQICY